MDTSAPATLLVFTRGPRGERLRRRLLPARAGGLERQLYRRCLEEAVEAGRAAGCRVAVASPVPLELDGPVVALPQRGDGFGERLRRAVAAAGLHAGPLVVVGTDAPGLTADAITDALDGLRDDPNRVVVGPSPDGGFYLLAAARPLDEVLAQVAWCRRKTLRTLLSALARAGRPVTLIAPLADLDRRADLERLIARGGADKRAPELWQALLRRLRHLLAELRQWAAPLAVRALRPAVVPVVPARGPPR